MKFTNYIENKEIVSEAFNEVNSEVATEGWALILARLATNFVKAGPSGIINPANVHWLISATNLNKLTKNKDFTGYIKKECDRILAEEKKSDKSVTKDCPNGPLKMFERWWHGSDDVPFFSLGRWLNWRSVWLDDKIWLDSIGGYNITFFYDTDHVDAIVVVLWSEDKEKFIGRRIPEPKKGDLQKIIRKEN